MNKPLKFSSKTHKLLICSDFHCGHNPNWADTPPLWKSRGFISIDEHDKWIRDEWFRLVDDDTIVFSLGDIVFSDPKGERFRQMTNWPGRTLALAGNHFSGLKQIYREVAKTRGIVDNEMLYPVTMGNITLVGESMSMWIDGVPVYASHYAPYIWPEIGSGSMCWTGHSHGRAQELNPDCTTFAKILDCGVDNAILYNKSPFFSWDDIKRIMNKKPIRKSDHH